MDSLQSNKTVTLGIIFSSRQKSFASLPDKTVHGHELHRMQALITSKWYIKQKEGYSPKELSNPWVGLYDTARTHSHPLALFLILGGYTFLNKTKVGEPPSLSHLWRNTLFHYNRNVSGLFWEKKQNKTKKCSSSKPWKDSFRPRPILVRE